MTVVPGAKLKTFIEFMKNPEALKPYLPRLDEIEQEFFREEFFNPKNDAVRGQIADRLWNFFGNRTLATMFNSDRNLVNMFEALNNGSVILIDTAKDFLHQQRCAVFGRFFIALLSQAIQERATIKNESQRTPTMIYIDEAHDYFSDDEYLAMLFSQARKYRCGITIAHQSL